MTRSQVFAAAIASSENWILESVCEVNSLAPWEGRKLQHVLFRYNDIVLCIAQNVLLHYRAFHPYGYVRVIVLFLGFIHLKEEVF